MDNPFVTVVVLTIGEIPERLQWCLDNQTYLNFEVLKASEKGIVNAMNSALDRARGDLFVRIDDDVELPKDWLKSLCRPFNDPRIAGVTGPTIVPNKLINNRDSIRFASKPNWFLRWMFDGKPWACAKIYKCGSVSYGSNFGTHHNGKHYFWSDYCDHLEGTNWAMRTELIREVGGFDPKFDGVAEWFDTDVEQKIKKLTPDYFFFFERQAYLYHILDKGNHFSQRFEGFGRIKNWLRFHIRHSQFHYKMVIWFLMMCCYFLLKNIRCKN